ncbi:S1 RNA-binding domain-containing protein [Streptomyces cinereoruber]|uniref:S1 RNA-binding domain-containing protein n=1 Tax=Streptomyces cinereoruber TaxID=67260 RepID=UPI003C30D307
MDQQMEAPELRAFLEALNRGEVLTGTVAAIERFGVFVALDDGPGHPVFPGVGFISVAELSWVRFDAPDDVVAVGERVSCEFLQFDTYNMEARLSLKALRPDPLRAFADRMPVGRELRGTVEKVLSVGAFVDLGEGLLGLVPFREVNGYPAAGRPEDFGEGEEVSVVVTHIERPTRRILLSGPRGTS